MTATVGAADERRKRILACGNRRVSVMVTTHTRTRTLAWLTRKTPVRKPECSQPQLQTCAFASPGGVCRKLRRGRAQRQQVTNGGRVSYAQDSAQIVLNSPPLACNCVSYFENIQPQRCVCACALLLQPSATIIVVSSESLPHSVWLISVNRTDMAASFSLPPTLDLVNYHQTDKNSALFQFLPSIFSWHELVNLTAGWFCVYAVIKLCLHL